MATLRKLKWFVFMGGVLTLLVFLTIPDRIAYAAPPSLQWSAVLDQTVASSATFSIRGVALSSDGTSVYTTWLQQSPTNRRVRKNHAITGALQAQYTLPAAPGNPVTCPAGREHARAIATDDRGYVYIGTGDRNIGCGDNPYLRVLSSDLATEVSGEITTTDVNTSAKRFGGLAIYKSGSNYYVYATREGGAGEFYIQRFDVTTAASPVLDTTFNGTGTFNLATLLPGVGFPRGIYVASDGTIYVASTDTGNPSTTGAVYKIAPDLLTATSVALTGAFDLAVFNGKAYVSRYLNTASNIGIVDVSTMTWTDTISTGFSHSNTATDSGYSGLDISLNGRLYVADQIYATPGGNQSDRLLMSSPLPNSATTVVVKPSALNGWAMAQETATASGSFVTGPGTPPLGTGSAQMALADATGGEILGAQLLLGTRFDQVTNLQYSTYRSSVDGGNNLAIALQFNADYDLTDGATQYQGRLVYEPYQTPGVGGTVAQNTWQTWDPLQGRWWMNTGSFPARVGNVVVANQCPQATPCTWAQFLNFYPNAGIHATLGAVIFKAGSNWSGFNGNVDAFSLGASGSQTTFDYEPETQCTTTCYVNAATGNDSFGGDAPTNAKKTIQAAVNQVSSGGTIYVAAGTYAQDLVIDKSLSLLGPNDTINPNTGSRVAEAVIQPSTSNPDPNVCTNMVYLETSNITIKGFTFDGDNPSLTSGVIINGSDVDACEIISSYEGIGNITVENNILKRATYAGIDFYNYYNSGSATSSNYIRYNRFEDIGSSAYPYGIGVLIYNNFYAAITNNVMTGVRVGIQTGNFSQPNPGTTNSISNNQIGSWRLGVFHNLWYGTASPLTLSNNTLTAENFTGATNYSGILLSSMGTTVGATVTGNIISVPGTDTHSGYTTGYNVWNVQNGTPITINGGTVTGGKYGVFVNNYEGYSSNADNTFIYIDGADISDALTAGLYVLDSPSNTNGATVSASIQNSTISNSGTGLLVEGSHGNASLTTTNVTASATNDALLVRSGGNVTANNTLDLNGDVTVQAGGTLAAGASSQINVAGDWTNNGTFTAGTGKVKFDGIVAQSIGGSGATAFNDLDLSNTHASGITSAVNLKVNGALAMNQDSNLNMGANTLTMGAASSPLTTGTGQGDVVGTVTRASFVSGTSYNFGSPFLGFMDLTFTGAPKDISVILATSAPGTKSNAILRTYTLNVNGGTDVNTNLRLHYRDDATTLNGNSESMLAFYRYSGTAWDDLGYTTRSQSENWVQHNSVSSFSDWTLANGTPTGVNLLSFTGRKTDAGVKLKWETSSGVSIIGFNVWRARGKGEYTKLNAEPIPARNPGDAIGSTYTYFDPLSKKGRYHYKLELLTTSDTQFSERISVRYTPGTNSCATVVDKAQQLSPKNKAVVRGKGVSFDWGDVACATRYEFTLREKSADGAVLVNETNLQVSAYEVAKLKAGLYFWSVRGCNAAGCGPAHTAQFTLQRKKD